MTLLLDTHILLWMVFEPRRLGRLEEPVADPGTVVLLSAVVTWELATKRALGRLQLPQPAGAFDQEQLSALALTPLSVDHDHAAAVEELPHHHRDPFDRLLVAQALATGATLATTDDAVADYAVPQMRP